MYQMMICDDYDHHRVILSCSVHCGNDLDQIIINWDQGVRTQDDKMCQMVIIIWGPHCDYHMVIIWSSYDGDHHCEYHYHY